jgi:hypothetical protein
LNTKLTIQLIAIFIAAISMAIVPAILTANATIVSTPGTSPDTLWTGSGPASDTIRLQYYTGLTGDTNEYNALCYDTATGHGCSSPLVDLTDVQIPTSMNNPTNNNNAQFYVTPSSPGLDWEHADFNLANSFFGVEFCNGSDGVVAGSACPLATYATPVTATCPGTIYLSGGLGDCTKAGIAVRQGVAHLLDKAQYVSSVLQNFGSPIDNILAPAESTLHSGLDYGLQTPCSTVGVQASACNPANQDTVGPYAVDPTQPIGSQQVWPPYLGGTFAGPACTSQAQIEGLAGSCYLAVGGACSWDILVGCGTFMGQTTVSANHLSGDGTATVNGDVTPGTPDFCAAAQDFVNAGLGTGVTSAATGCQIINFCANNGGGTSCFTTGTAGLPGNNPVLLYRRTSLDRGPLTTGLGAAICELINGPTVTTCAQVKVSTISLAQAGGLVFSTGCKSATEAGTTCSTQGPNRTWNMYSGGNTLAVTINTLFFETTLQDSSDLCGGTAAGEEPSAYYMICNTAMDTWANYGEFAPLPNNAVADTQVANDIAGNHTFVINLQAHAAQYAWLSGWQGVCNAPGVGIAQGNFNGLLNAWNPSPAVAGPTLRWGQKDSPDTLNPFSATTVTDFDVIQEVYDSLLVGTCYNLSSLYGYMVNSYQIVQNPGVINPTAQTDSNCPLNVQTGDGLWPVGGCVKLVLRGDNSWQDIYNCAPTVSSCLASHSVTASDVKFTWQNINATGGLLTGNTANTVDVLYNPSSLPSSAFGSSGGTQANGQPEILYIALKQLSAWALFDIAAIPILPQHVWATASATSLPCLSPSLGSSTVTDLHASDPACKADSAKLSGPGADPIANNREIGSSAFACASGTLGASGTVYGGGCSTSGTDTPAAGDSITLRRFQYQGTSASQQGSLNLNFAYFRTNGKYKNFAWADYLALGSGTNNGFGAHGLVAINDIQSVASCLGKSAPAGTCTSAVFTHWSSPAATVVNLGSTVGPNIGVVNGGVSPVSIGTVAQVSRWYLTQWYDQQASTASLPAPLQYGVNGNQLAPGTEPAPGSGTQVLYEDGTQETS